MRSHERPPGVCHYSTHTTAPLGVWVEGEREGEGLISRAHVHGGRREEVSNGRSGGREGS